MEADRTPDRTPERTPRRAHVTSGNTPGKPRRKSLRFHGEETKVEDPVKLFMLQNKSPYRKWTQKEETILIEFIALHHSVQGTGAEWPSYSPEHPFWEEAAQNLAEGMGQTPRRPSSIRQRVVNVLKGRYGTVESAELVLDIDYGGESDKNEDTDGISVEALLNKASALTSADLSELCDKIFTELLARENIPPPGRDFVKLSVQAMKKLSQNNKSNVVYKMAKVVAVNRPDSTDSLLPLDRMPWGLIQYQIDFFACAHINEISISDDYVSWLESLDAEFQGRLIKILRGPMWSGQDQARHGDPLKANVNMAMIGPVALHKRVRKSPYTDKPEIQMEALAQLKSSFPSGRFWIKADATDLKVCLQESVRGVWNGDSQLHPMKLQELQTSYEQRKQTFASFRTKDIVQQAVIITDLEDDLVLLHRGLITATNRYTKVLETANSSREKLKEAAWDAHEYQELLQQAQILLSDLEDAEDIVHAVKSNREVYSCYLRNLYKKKRDAATHVLVIMVAEEKRLKKPYALPVQYIPYASIRDQEIRDVLVQLKTVMTNMGMVVAGVCTDGEFHTLRTRGDTRSLHVYQLMHDARDAVKRMSSETLRQMLTIRFVDAQGHAIAVWPNLAISEEYLWNIRNWMIQGMTFQNAAVMVRASQVPTGYAPHPFREGVPESLLDTMRSIVATCIYRFRIEELMDEGVDFKTHLFVPEVDTITGQQIHERSDHNHLLKRIATSTREGHYVHLDLQAFDDAMLDPNTGLTQIALQGIRKQSVPDAERLLSFRVANFMLGRGYQQEGEYVQIMAGFHEGWDGRGLSQLQRCRANYRLLNYILDDLMPWHRDRYDFGLIDVNSPTNRVRGMSYQTMIEVTGAIESGEMRRCQLGDFGPEHPRASSTDDVKGFFVLSRRLIGQHFSLKEFVAQWRKITRELVKRLDPNPPFYLWTSRDPYDQELAPFDAVEDADEDHGYGRRQRRLHMLRRNAREDPAIFVAGRALIPARHGAALRQRLYRPVAQLPDVH